LLQLLKRKQVVQALDSLWDFTGLWDALELGNIHKHLALHCDEQIISYLNHVRSIWNQIFKGLESLKVYLDIETVQMLQFKAPGVYAPDGEQIRDYMTSGQLFTLIKDGRSRQMLLNNIMGLSNLIPSIKSFHADMKYFAIGAKILTKFVEQVKYTNGRRPREKNRISLMDSICSDWKMPEKPCIEVQEDTFLPARITMTARIAFLMLFISTQRQFSYLSHNCPLQDTKDKRVVGCIDERYVQLLRERAQKLGFQNKKLEVSETNATRREMVDFVGPRLNYLPPVWRGGVPFTSTYIAIQKDLFLPGLQLERKYDRTLDHMFTQTNFVRAFFGQLIVPPLDGSLVFEFQGAGSKSLPSPSRLSVYSGKSNRLKRLTSGRPKANRPRQRLRQRRTALPIPIAVDEEADTSMKDAVGPIPLQLPEIISQRDKESGITPQTLQAVPVRPHREPGPIIPQSSILLPSAANVLPPREVISVASPLREVVSASTRKPVFNTLAGTSHAAMVHLASSDDGRPSNDKNSTDLETLASDHPGRPNPPESPMENTLPMSPSGSQAALVGTNFISHEGPNGKKPQGEGLESFRPAQNRLNRQVPKLVQFTYLPSEASSRKRTNPFFDTSQFVENIRSGKEIYRPAKRARNEDVMDNSDTSRSDVQTPEGKIQDKIPIPVRDGTRTVPSLLKHNRVQPPDKILQPDSQGNEGSGDGVEAAIQPRLEQHDELPWNPETNTGTRLSPNHENSFAGKRANIPNRGVTPLELESLSQAMRSHNNSKKDERSEQMMNETDSRLEDVGNRGKTKEVDVQSMVPFEIPDDSDDDSIL
jgi:hypothetical protein